MKKLQNYTAILENYTKYSEKFPPGQREGGQLKGRRQRVRLLLRKVNLETAYRGSNVSETRHG